MKAFTYIVILIVAAAIIAGFFVVGSPSEERLRRFDEKRIQDLQFIQGEIVSFWQAKARLPDDLTKLHDSIRGIIIPVDPENGQTYLYTVKSELTFELCADFNLPSYARGERVAPLRAPKPAVVGGQYASTFENWEHAEGFACFERTIDPDIYKLPKRD